MRGEGRAETWRSLLRLTEKEGNLTTSIVDVSGELKGETDKAYKFFDGDRTVWLSKELCQWDQDDKTMAMPEWLATEKGLV